jgi:hypothetical protein
MEPKMTSRLKKRPVPFQPEHEFELAIQNSFTERLADEFKKHRDPVMSPENVFCYTHGRDWKHPAKIDCEDSTMETHSAEISLPFERLVEGDLSLITDSITHISIEFQKQFMQSLYALVNRTCEQTGNTVQSTPDGFPQAFEEMLRKIEFGVDRNGKISMPQLHSGDPEKLIEALESQPPEYQERINKLIKQKTENAFENEQQRKSRFKAE